jgi:circadian clock protein KaiB
MGDPDTKEQFWQLRLYITGRSGRSQRAIENLKSVCEEHLSGRYQIEIIDLKEHPERAKEEGIFATPTLIRQLPPSVRKIIGDLSDINEVLVGLELKRQESSSEYFNSPVKTE